MSNARQKRRIRKYVTRFITDLSMVPEGYVNQTDYYTKCDISYAHNQGYVPAVKLVRSTNDRRGPVFVSKIHADAWVIEDRVRRQMQEQARLSKEHTVQLETNAQPPAPAQGAVPTPPPNNQQPQSAEEKRCRHRKNANTEALAGISTKANELNVMLDRQGGTINETRGLVENHMAKTDEVLAKLNEALVKLNLLMEAWDVEEQEEG
jgi:hypothetical protein